MASKPKTVYANELCSKCRPHPLGVLKKLKNFEVFVDDGEKGEKGQEEVRGAKRELNSNSSIDWGVSADEIEKALDPQNQTETQTAPEPSPRPAPKILENEPILDQPSDSAVSTDTEGKRERWVDVCPSAENGEVAPSVQLNKKNIFSRIFKSLVTSEDPFPETKIEEDAGEDVRVGEEGNSEGWVKVKEDPDWEVLSDEESKEKLWKDVEDWINVKE
jgi:hypothetical protein